jgi:RecB family endonuclease NucS
MSQAERILRVLRNADRPLKDTEIADRMDGVGGSNAIYHRLMDLHESGKIKKVDQRPRKWALTDGTNIDQSIDTMSDEQKEPQKTQLSLERDVQEYLSERLDDIEQGLSVQSDRTGLEVQVDSGRVDILAEDTDGDLVVIEIKAGEAKRAVLGQIKAYMADVIDELSETGDVRGIIVSEDFSQQLTRAMTLENNIELYTYRVEFSFDEY